MKFCFGDIVVVETNLIGVIVKSWSDINTENFSYDVYVRYFNEIRKYPEELIQRYMVRHKYLSGEEIIWQDNAINNRDNSISDIICGYALSNEQVNILMMDIKTLLQKYDCPENQVEPITEALNNNDIVMTRELLRLEPIKLLNDFGLSQLQYSILVATILGADRDFDLHIPYTFDTYMEVVHKYRNKKHKGE